MLNHNKRHKQNAEERFPEYSLDSGMQDQKKDMKKKAQRKLKKLHRSVDLDFVKSCLPKYGGDFVMSLEGNELRLTIDSSS